VALAKIFDKIVSVGVKIRLLSRTGDFFAALLLKHLPVEFGVS